MADDVGLNVTFETASGARQSIVGLHKKLDAIPKSLRNKGARKATRAAAKVVLEDARMLVPHDTGELERSLRVKARKRSRRDKGTVGHQVISGEDNFRGDQFYGAFVELGTQKMDADPFLRPALWGNQTKKLQVYRNVLAEWLKNDAPKAK